MRLVPLLLLLACVLGAQNPPAQPIPFSHKTHAGTLKMQCKMCHPESGSRRNDDSGRARRLHAVPQRH